MQATSETWKSLWNATETRREYRVIIAGSTYTDEVSAPVITRALMQDRLSVGNVVSAECHFDIRTSNAIARSAAVQVDMRLTDGTTTSEWLPQGTFYISKRQRGSSGLLSLECYDGLLKANAVWTPSAGAWPRSMSAVANELAGVLGLSLDSRNTIASYSMDEPKEGTTIREALSMIGAANGGNWIVSPAGALRLVPITDSLTSSQDSSAVEVIGVLTALGYDNLGTISGVRYYVDGAPTELGDDTGLIVDMGDYGAYALDVYDILVGMTYQPYQLSGALYDPAAELGDGLRAGVNGEIQSLLVCESITLLALPQGGISAPSMGELPDEYPYIDGAANQALQAAKAYAQEAVNALDDNLTQQEIFNRLTDNGAAQGLILYNGQLYVNATYINAGELNAALVHVTNLDASDISSGIIHSNDYRTIVVDMLYPLTTLYPADTLYPNIGEEVVSGFAINFELGRIYGGEYSAEIESLTQSVIALQNSLVYPKSAS